MEAKEYFLQAIKISDNASDSIIETILSNLAHTFRKLKDFKNAI
jgi:anaphase-promoting complex subunit 6